MTLPIEYTLPYLCDNSQPRKDLAKDLLYLKNNYSLANFIVTTLKQEEITFTYHSSREDKNSYYTNSNYFYHLIDIRGSPKLQDGIKLLLDTSNRPPELNFEYSLFIRDRKASKSVLKSDKKMLTILDDFNKKYGNSTFPAVMIDEYHITFTCSSSDLSEIANHIKHLYSYKRLKLDDDIVIHIEKRSIEDERREAYKELNKVRNNTNDETDLIKQLYDCKIEPYAEYIEMNGSYHPLAITLTLKDENDIVIDNKTIEKCHNILETQIVKALQRLDPNLELAKVELRIQEEKPTLDLVIDDEEDNNTLESVYNYLYDLIADDPLTLYYELIENKPLPTQSSNDKKELSQCQSSSLPTKNGPLSTQIPNNKRSGTKICVTKDMLENGYKNPDTRLYHTQKVVNVYIDYPEDFKPEMFISKGRLLLFFDLYKPDPELDSSNTEPSLELYTIVKLKNPQSFLPKIQTVLDADPLYEDLSPLVKYKSHYSITMDTKNLPIASIMDLYKTFIEKPIKIGKYILRMIPNPYDIVDDLELRYVLDTFRTTKVLTKKEWILRFDKAMTKDSTISSLAFSKGTIYVTFRTTTLGERLKKLRNVLDV